MAGRNIVIKKVKQGKVRKFEGKIVKPCLYNGKWLGHGKYLAAMIDDQLVLDKDGKPILFHSLGRLENP